MSDTTQILRAFDEAPPTRLPAKSVWNTTKMNQRVEAKEINEPIDATMFQPA